MAWFRTIAIGGAIATQGCVLELPEVDDDDDDAGDESFDGDGDDTPADESASHTSEVDTDEGDDPVAERLPLECVAPIEAGCELLRARDLACDGEGTDVGYGSDCEQLVELLFPRTAACCTALVEFMTCVSALPCDGTGCALDPDNACAEA